MTDEELNKLSYADLKVHIRMFEERAEQVRLQELESIIIDIKAQIVAYNITAKDLGFSDFANLDNKTEAKKTVKSLPPKYRSSDGKKEWNGRGPKPKWLAKELTEGKILDEFLIYKKNINATPVLLTDSPNLDTL